METEKNRNKKEKEINSFNEKCYDILKNVPFGKVTTYKEIAKALNCKAYRAVGNAMNKNPYAPKVPCHRVVRSDGGVGGFATGSKQKEKILFEEGIFVENGKVINFEKVLFRFG